MSVLYHGGAPDLKPGDYIEPGHSRDNYDDCPICRARRGKGADAIEETPDKLTIILDKETMRLSEYPVNGVPVEELNGYIDEMANSMNLLSKQRLFARDIMTGAKAATAACIRGLEKIIRKHEARS